MQSGGTTSTVNSGGTTWRGDHLKHDRTFPILPYILNYTCEMPLKVQAIVHTYTTYRL